MSAQKKDPNLYRILNGLRKGVTYSFPVEDWDYIAHPTHVIKPWFKKKLFHTRKRGNNWFITRI